MKVVIVGGVAGGMSAATRLRRLDETAEIIVLEQGPYVSFANCGLPYYLSGEIQDRADLIVQTPAKLKQRFNIDVRVNQRVTAVVPDQHQLSVQVAGQTVTESYDKLILAPGAVPVVPDLPGLATAPNVSVLRNIPDLDRLMAKLSTTGARTVTLVGGGFISLEMAEALRRRGLTVTIVEQASHVLPPLDEEMAAGIQHTLTQQGVRVITGQAVASVRDNGRTLVLADETQVQTDQIVLAVGVRPATDFLATSGIHLGLRGGIEVDETYQTSAPDVYAVGDAIVVRNQVSGQPALISLASPANRQGRQVADNLIGLPHHNRGSVGTAIVRVFDTAATMTGLNEAALQAQQLPYKAAHYRGSDHADYFPGAQSLLLKLLFNPQSGELYGAQAVGHGVDKRIDVLATAIKGHLTVADLPELELSYAPPFGSAKDPVNLVGEMAQNIMDGLSDNRQWHELKAAEVAGRQLLDVRNPTELAAGRFPMAINIPLDQLRDRLSELDPQQPYIVSCQSGHRSYVAERILKQHGFDVVNLDGGFALYQTVRPDEVLDD
ncbi:MAG: FAD-dependent oxidoreductase [Levilactobacillus sp.]|jgi:NADPH-dependent 2,4-dienoyl-CoA reductase/sulfur reductase-like enzyme/rhodanese-related sulfurtransferase|uniref:FAD-dependent oxidoreductase n=1 Tax=Levilactobacillus sp. TaxID=2767919 RepID=UPI002582B7FF|nr:FAD-dependent oxidoreductase [Levilactobacillus sp.]MCH4124029.1 FAD-dependent oxidoreductase [Levilactobacillus sp.]MCI1554135.1 FAD-dependent oxidoreductase [Levilactobacillus sp.]MCI1599339.1 FAD-dependent oxidoreductase [Levilactobacillus sp.]